LGLTDDISADIKEYLNSNILDDVRLIQKGLMLYRQGMVHQLQIGQKEVTAVVQDVTPCKVRLDLQYLSLSHCSCPGDGVCRHLMAVFFAVHAKEASVTTWVEEWREPMREKKAFTDWGVQTAKDLIKANGPLKPDYGSWVHSFEVSFDTLLQTKKYTSPYVVTELFEIYWRRVQASAPVEQEWKLLYELVGIVISFRKLARLSEEAGHNEEAVKRAYLHLFDDMLDDAEQLIGKIGVQSLPFDFDDFVVSLKDDARELLTVVSGLAYERFYLYRLLWTGLFRKKTWREEELGRIGTGLKELFDWQNPLPLMLARIHLNLLLGDDEQVLKNLNLIEDDVITPYMLQWINYLTGQKAWKRVGPLIELFLVKLKAYLEVLGGYHSCTSFTRTAVKAVAPYCVETGRTDLFERTLTSTLPYSFADYEYMLFERGQYDRWGELQAFVGLNFNELPKERVKVVEKEMPEVLLGMLHQTVQVEIDQKNRSSYKQAVKHLKKLRTIYKKLKRSEDFQYYMETLLERTKRLRAFHEECNRAKLV
jgi:hypothetical protein